MVKWCIPIVAVALLAHGAWAAEPKMEQATPGGEEEVAAEPKWAPAVAPKPLSEQVNKGLAWLVEHQLPAGAWGQGEESQHMGGGAQMKDLPSVADTSAAGLALLRSGSTPAKGPYAQSLLKAVEFVAAEVQRSDKDSLYVTETRGTRAQSKLGPYIDTFLANLFLSEVQGQMPDKASNERARIALDKILAKIQKNQRADGTWNDQGWAPTIGQSLAVKGLNRAAQAGRKVDEKVLDKAEEYSNRQFNRQSGKFSETGSAGVELYSASSNVAALSDSVNTKAQKAHELRQDLAAKPAAAAEPAQVAALETQLAEVAKSKKDLEAVQQAVIAKLDDKQFIAGFGSNGGEEFLSYMNIGESLVVKGGDAWKAWDKSITENLNRVQNADGSWTGHHCITGRTFCTSAALLVLMVDLTPVPLAAKIGRR